MAKKSSSSVGLRIKCSICRAFFIICPHCFRGHRYCSNGCSDEARRLSKKRADRHYRSTARGRGKRRFSQNRYRKSLRLKELKKPKTKTKNKNVNDQSSPRSLLNVNRKQGNLVLKPKKPSQPRCVKCGTNLNFLRSVSWRWFKKGNKFDYGSKHHGSNEEDVLCRASPR